MTYVPTRTSAPGATRIPCCDVFNRRSTVGVALDSTGRVTLAAPPGEVAVLTPRQARLLGRQLLDLANDRLGTWERT